MDLPQDLTRLAGLPYLKHGRGQRQDDGRRAYDCLGIVLRVYEYYGFEVLRGEDVPVHPVNDKMEVPDPLFMGHPEVLEESVEEGLTRSYGDWFRVVEDQPKVLDLLLFKNNEHLAVIIHPGFVLTTRDNSTSSIVRFDKIAARVKERYRHVAL